jgi:hypothetical protein
MPPPHGHDRVSEQRDGSWIVVAPAAKGWRARRPRTRISPEHPGTALSWDGELFEVVAAHESEGGEARYSLERWSDRHTIRVLENYDEAAEEGRARARLDDAFRSRRRCQLLLLAPLAGHVPAQVQDRWEREYDVSGSLLTLISAMPLFVFGALCSVSLTIRAFTGVSVLPLPGGVLVLGLYLLVESGMRLSAAWGEGRPAGSLAGTLAWEVVHRLRDRRSPERRR